MRVRQEKRKVNASRDAADRACDVEGVVGEIVPDNGSVLHADVAHYGFGLASVVEKVCMPERERAADTSLIARGDPVVLRGSAARSLLRVDICLYINTFLAPLACPELLHRVVEGGPVTYPFFNGFYANDFVARFRKSGIRRTRCGLAKSLLPVDLSLIHI